MHGSPNAETDVQIDDILARVAHHMTCLATTVAATETAISEHFEESMTQNGHSFQDVQNLDYLRQSITDTSDLLQAISRGCRTQLELIQNLKLETTRALVQGHDVVAPTSDCGEIDWL